MKRVIVFVLAICLAVPAISYAGSATSRWDLMIGGNIKFTTGWVDGKGIGDLNASGIPGRDDAGSFETADNEYGHQVWGSGEAGLNFFIRGPEVWGAKTSAFLLMDFTGVWGGSNYGSADLLVATMSFDWPNTTLMIGDAGSAFGMLPTFAGNQSSWGAVGLFGDKGAAPILSQITATQRFTKTMSAKFGIMANANNMRNGNNFPTPSAAADVAAHRSTTPGVQGGFTYSSGACGKVGPWQLTLGTSGGYIRQKQVYNNATGTLDDDDTDGWLADFKVLVPIIPEKNGNKSGALYFDGVIWTGQNFDGFNAGFGNAGTGVYNRNYGADRATNPDYAARSAYGYYLHGAYYFTDAVWFNAFYMRGEARSSAAYKKRETPNPVAGLGGVEWVSQWIFSLCWDASPATRFTVQWDKSYSRFANPEYNAAGQMTKKDEGNQNTYRVAAYYYF